MDNQEDTNNVSEGDSTPTFMIQLDQYGDPHITANVAVPIPYLLGVLDLVKMQLGAQYFAGIMHEKQKEAATKPQIVVPNLTIKR